MLGTGLKASLRGRRTLTHPDGSTYDGHWKEGCKSGQGTLVYTTGSRFSGEWKDDVICGNGKLTMISGLTYDGGWKKGKFSGTGTLTLPNRKTYTGSFENGLRSGEGSLTWADGSFYVGHWKKNKRDGYGELTQRGHGNGDFLYSGHWSKGKRSGKGKMEQSDGGVYDGSWREGKPHGAGTFVFGKHSIYVRYEGEWSDGKRHGRGVLTLHNKEVRRGQFRHDQMISGSIEYPNGTLYDGRWAEGDPSVQGAKLSVLPPGLKVNASKLKRGSVGKMSIGTAPSNFLHVPALNSLTHEESFKISLPAPVSGVVTTSHRLQFEAHSSESVAFQLAPCLPLLEFDSPSGYCW
eukprot:TRINITY_DN10487_c0_g1_i1.p1 TRINITY_DN10487_c0_g1~~TRINITY_DN10487_c0_g1_i1.p1  ORF type:complete len:349 (-),score=46.24 TRINITY_DN10487_c0_g1_i1:123-1169(-)